MSSSSLRIVVGAAVALAISGTALANTNLDGSTTGDIFLNIVDNTAHTSYEFDTGIAQSAFTGTSSLPSVNLTTITNGNYNSFISGASGHSLTYSVVSATGDGFGATVFYTSTLTASSVVGTLLGNSWASLNNFTPVANNQNSASTVDAFVPAGSPPWGDPSVEGIFSSNLTANATGDSAAIGTPMSFYGQTTADITDSVTQSTLTKFLGQWDLTSAGLLTYTVGAAVPLPAPLLLLLSGLGLTGLLGRRKSLTAQSEAIAV